MPPTRSKSSRTLARCSAIALALLALHAPASAADPLQSIGESLSADGRFVVFMSNATDLVPGQVDGNHGFDVFLRDRFARTTTLVSHAAGALTTAASGGFSGSFAGPVSDDGRYVTFLSDATNLVAGVVDTNQALDLFLFDRVQGKITLLSHAAGAPTVAANGATISGLISRDGSTIAFISLAKNLVAGQVDSNQQLADGGADVFLYHRPTGTLSLASHRSGASSTTGNGSSLLSGMSSDGGVLVFTSNASDLLGGLADTNGKSDVFAYQRSSGAVSLVSRASGLPVRTSNGFSSGAQISGDGRFVAFHGSGDDLVAGQVETGALYDEFLFDRASGKTLLVSHKSGAATRAVGVGAHALSADGRYLAFASTAPNLVAGQVDTNGKLDVFLFDRVAGTTVLVTHRPGAFTATTAGSSGVGLDIDGAGRSVTFVSDAANLVPGQVDTGGHGDAFLYDRVTRALSLVSHRRTAPTTAADDSTLSAAVSRDGTTVGLTSAASDLTDVPPRSVDSSEVYAAVRGGGDVEGVSVPTAEPFAACAFVDTRTALPLDAGVRVFLNIAGHCGVPSSARSVALRVTALEASGAGNLQLFPGNVTSPATGVLRFPQAAARTGEFTVPLATNGHGTVAILPQVANHGTVHLVVVVTGYSD